jgi:hypothetical protein
VDADTEVISAFAGNADLFAQRNSGVEKTVVAGVVEAGLDGGGSCSDEVAILIEEVGAELDGAVPEAVWRCEEVHGAGIGSEIDLIAAVGAVGEIGIGPGGVAGSERVFDGGGGEDAGFEDNLGRLG